MTECKTCRGECIDNRGNNCPKCEGRGASSTSAREAGAMIFTDTELSAISNALAVARERFRENSAELRQMTGGLMYGRLADQFDQQTAALDALIERIAEEAGC